MHLSIGVEPSYGARVTGRVNGLDRVAPEQAHQREFERSFWAGPLGRGVLEEEGIRTVGMRPLRDLMRDEGGRS